MGDCEGGFARGHHVEAELDLRDGEAVCELGVLVCDMSIMLLWVRREKQRWRTVNREANSGGAVDAIMCKRCEIKMINELVMMRNEMLEMKERGYRCGIGGGDGGEAVGYVIKMLRCI